MRIARFSVDDEPRYGVVETEDPEGLVGTVSVLDSDPLYRPVQFTGEKLQLADVRLLAPVLAIAARRGRTYDHGALR